MEMLLTIFSPEGLAATLRLSISVAFATLGTIFAGRSGILCMGQEGMMLITGCLGVVFSFYSGNPYIALLGAMLAGLVLGLLYAYFAVSQGGNHVIIGVGMNFFGQGISALIIPIVWGNQGSSPAVTGFQNFMTVLQAKSMGAAAQIFGTQNWMLVILLGAVAVSWVVLYQTPVGLRIRIAGELPMAVECTGGSVKKLRYLCMGICGIFMALAGCMVTLGQAKMFSRNMMSGRGFIALALCTLGRYHPVGALIMSLLYGFTDAVQIRLQGEGIPSQFVQMLPYLFTIAIITMSGSIHAPSSLGKPFKSVGEER